MLFNSFAISHNTCYFVENFLLKFDNRLREGEVEIEFFIGSVSGLFLDV